MHNVYNEYKVDSKVEAPRRERVGGGITTVAGVLRHAGGATRERRHAGG